MPRLSATPIVLDEAEREGLDKLLKRPSTAQQIVLRAKIILQAASGEGHGDIARGLNISRDMSRLWRRRWLELAALEVPVAQRLQDAPRPGGPPTFSIEQKRVTLLRSMDGPSAIGLPENSPMRWSNRA